MKIIGITGPTGAGKTTLLREVENLSGGVIDCDRVYHDLLDHDAALQDSLERAFGPVRDGEGKIDRKKLGSIVFHDPEQLAALNAIVEQAMVSATRELVEKYRDGGKTLIAIDAIALLESPLREMCALTVAVLAPPEVRIRRIMAREGIPEDYARSRVQAQKPEEYFLQNCDYILRNDCSTAEEFARKAREFLTTIYI